MGLNLSGETGLRITIVRSSDEKITQTPGKFDWTVHLRGLQRVHGSFVLATNMDILFSNGSVEFLASGNLQKNRMYRIVQYDIPADLPKNLPIN